MKKIIYLMVTLALFSSQSFGQAISKSYLEDEETPMVTCGSYNYLEHVDKVNPGFLEQSNVSMEQIGELIKNQITEKSATEVYTIPVVFHVLHFSEESNLSDEVLESQIEVLNKSFRRQNADTSELREVFEHLVGDSYIQFKLAEQDPLGNPTNGIVRKATEISHFGGVLPYGQGEELLISQWVQDSLMYNYFRMTQSELGGSDSWDESRYLNIWIGDMRILEPLFNDFEEMVYFALATPPLEHANWDGLLETFQDFNQGVLIDYHVVGSNNPTMLPYPYHIYNQRVKGGKMLVHEVGHYLGLRHIWGDVLNCSADDYVYDTPNTTGDSEWNCDKVKNKCVDVIYGEDLPDMIENYMDYSHLECQNSFTKGQIEIMRHTLENFRTELYETTLRVDEEYALSESFEVFPNPTDAVLNIRAKSPILKVLISDLNGRIIETIKAEEQKELSIPVSSLSKGAYLLHLETTHGVGKYKFVKQ